MLFPMACFIAEMDAEGNSMAPIFAAGHRFRRRVLPGSLVLLMACLAGCSTPRAPDIATPESLSPQPYTRVTHSDTNTVRLQIAIREFVPGGHRGPSIWLVGTSHIGDPAYYHALQGYLDARTVVLYEGINTEAHRNHVPGAAPVFRPPAASPSPDPPRSAAEGFSMQATMAKSLGLVFQLDAIDYNRANFLNSDLSLAQLQRLMTTAPAATGASGAQTTANPSFNSLLQIMDGSSFLGSLFKIGLQFVGANPKLQALVKLALIEALGQLKGDFSQMRGLPPDMKEMVKVLIDARNQNVIADLQTERKLVPRSGSIAVFYGTGHMEDLERRVTRDLHYRPSHEVWLTAFSIDVGRSGLSSTEVQAMRNLVQWQLGQLQP